MGRAIVIDASTFTDIYTEYEDEIAAEEIRLERRLEFLRRRHRNLPNPEPPVREIPPNHQEEHKKEEENEENDENNDVPNFGDPNPENPNENNYSDI